MNTRRSVVKFSRICAGVCAGLFAVMLGVCNAQLIYSNNSTNYQATVYALGATNQLTMLVITNTATLNLRTRVSNIGTGNVWMISSLNSTSLPTVVTNDTGRGDIKITPGTTVTISEWPIVNNRSWCAYTDSTTTGSLISITIDLP